MCALVFLGRNYSHSTTSQAIGTAPVSRKFGGIIICVDFHQEFVSNSFETDLWDLNVFFVDFWLHAQQFL